MQSNVQALANDQPCGDADHSSDIFLYVRYNNKAEFNFQFCKEAVEWKD